MWSSLVLDVLGLPNHQSPVAVVDVATLVLTASLSNCLASIIVSLATSGIRFIVLSTISYNLIRYFDFLLMGAVLRRD